MKLFYTGLICLYLQEKGRLIMKDVFEKPEITITVFELEDVIMTSPGACPGGENQMPEGGGI